MPPHSAATAAGAGAVASVAASGHCNFDSPTRRALAYPHIGPGSGRGPGERGLGSGQDHACGAGREANSARQLPQAHEAISQVHRRKGCREEGAGRNEAHRGIGQGGVG
eukprot:scaffold22155_cov101-Isochrysis_galbana.AAC.1